MFPTDLCLRLAVSSGTLSQLTGCEPRPMPMLPGCRRSCCAALVGKERVSPGSFYLSDMRGPPRTPLVGSLPGGGTLPFPTPVCRSRPSSEEHLLLLREGCSLCSWVLPGIPLQGLVLGAVRSGHTPGGLWVSAGTWGQVAASCHLCPQPPGGAGGGGVMPSPLAACGAAASSDPCAQPGPRSRR